MKKYEEIQVTLDLVLDEEMQKDLDFITEYYRTLKHNGTTPFKHYTREYCLELVLEKLAPEIISKEADFYRILSPCKDDKKEG